MSCLSKVSRLLPSTLAQSYSRARFLGHCPPPWPLPTWASRLPGEFCSHLTASLLRCIFSCCALHEAPECLAFSGDCWLPKMPLCFLYHLWSLLRWVLSRCASLCSESGRQDTSLDVSSHLSINWFGCTWTPLCQCECGRADRWRGGGLAGLGWGCPHAGHWADDVSWESPPLSIPLGSEQVSQASDTLI